MLLAFLTQRTNLLDIGTYSEAQTLFIIVDDPGKWPQPLDSDVWEIQTFGQANQLKPLLVVMVFRLLNYKSRYN